MKEVAQRIKDAQASGLPGVYGSRTVLTHLCGDGQIQDNRDKACLRRLRRPTPRTLDPWTTDDVWGISRPQAYLLVGMVTGSRERQEARCPRPTARSVWQPAPWAK
ncbi:hypothetical protein [Streptomyces sp. NPDC002671]